MSGLSFLFAVAIGVLVASFRISPITPLRVVGLIYVEVFRNIPLPVQFVLFYFGLTKVGIQFEPYTSAVIVLAVYTGAFVAEAVRSGFSTVPAGQVEAARSLGLGFLQVLGQVVLPQSLRTVVAPLGGLFLALLRNSAIASAIGVGELVYVGETVGNELAKPFEALLGVAAAYLVVTYPAGLLLGVVERKVAIRR